MNTPLTDAELEALENKAIAIKRYAYVYIAPNVERVIKELRALREQNAALVAALEAARRFLTLPGSGFKSYLIEDIDAALASVKRYAS